MCRVRYQSEHTSPTNDSLKNASPTFFFLIRLDFQGLIILLRVIAFTPTMDFYAIDRRRNAGIMMMVRVLLPDVDRSNAFQADSIDKLKIKKEKKKREEILIQKLRR